MLDVAPEIEKNLRDYALREGVSINELIARAFPPVESQKDRIARAITLINQWQKDDGTRILPDVPSVEGSNVTPSERLFQQWDEEDANMNDEQRHAAEEMWEAFKEGINSERARSGMRLIF